MAETSNIAWTRSTFNTHIGCTKVGPGCDHCYAEVSTPARALGVKWGPGQPRHRTSVKNWNLPLRWNKCSAMEREAGFHWEGAPDMPPGFWPVFCSSLADVFDNEVPQEWRDDLWRLIHETKNLSWLLVTKRIGNVAGMVLPRWMNDGFPPNVRLMITVCNQEEADRDIPKLLALNCKNGISYEPALGPVDWDEWLDDSGGVAGYRDAPKCGVQWIIVGGKSNQGQHKAREFHVEWMRSTIQQGHAAGVPVFPKQLGSNVICNGEWMPGISGHGRILLRDRAGADPSEWPESLRVREFPR